MVKFHGSVLFSLSHKFQRIFVNKTMFRESESETALSGRRVVEGSSLVCFLFSPKRGW